MLLHILRHLATDSHTSVGIVSVREGPLLEDFARFAPVTILETGWTRFFSLMEQGLDSVSQRLGHRGLAAASAVVRAVRRTLMRRRFGKLAAFSCIYANSAVACICFDALPPDHPPLITHVHELEFGLRHGIPPRAMKHMFEKTDHFVACSLAVRDNLTINHGVPEEKVDLCYEPVDGASLADARRRYERKDILNELSLPHNALVIGACGTREWRKGTDLFGLVAAKVLRQRPADPIYFLWVGGTPAHLSDAQFLFDFEKLGLDDRLRLIDFTAEPHRYFSIFDVFLLTSREDPFPLAALEAATLGIPVVAFDSGGASEMLGNGMGSVVKYADVDSMAEAAVSLLADSHAARSVGAKTSREFPHIYEAASTTQRILGIIAAATHAQSRAQIPRRDAG
ncbi:MAG: glycosyltransferase family 4 protein [Actinomycetota bacterium]|nr:glycosyltransferase family 4 protein [Actinomycetota bacterium]